MNYAHAAHTARKERVRDGLKGLPRPDARSRKEKGLQEKGRPLPVLEERPPEDRNRKGENALSEEELPREGFVRYLLIRSHRSIPLPVFPLR